MIVKGTSHAKFQHQSHADENNIKKTTIKKIELTEFILYYWFFKFIYLKGLPLLNKILRLIKYNQVWKWLNSCIKLKSNQTSGFRFRTGQSYGSDF